MLTDVLVLLVSLVVILFAAEPSPTASNGWVASWVSARAPSDRCLRRSGPRCPRPSSRSSRSSLRLRRGSHEVGVGAILGAPFMLSTLAMFVTGVAIVAFRARRTMGTVVAVDTGIAYDLRYFFVGYGLAVGAAFLPADLSAAR